MMLQRLTRTVELSRTSTKNEDGRIETEVEAGDLEKGMWVERNEHLNHGTESKGRRGPYDAGSDGRNKDI